MCPYCILSLLFFCILKSACKFFFKKRRYFISARNVCHLVFEGKEVTWGNWILSFSLDWIVTVLAGVRGFWGCWKRLPKSEKLWEITCQFSTFWLEFIFWENSDLEVGILIRSSSNFYSQPLKLLQQLNSSILIMVVRNVIAEVLWNCFWQTIQNKWQDRTGKKENKQYTWCVRNSVVAVKVSLFLFE